MTELTSKNWRPLRTTVHAFVYKFFGIEPLPYHLLNIIFNGLVVVLLFCLLLQLIKDMFSALVGAGLFAVHPVNTEVVCWSKSLEDLLAATFLLITFNLLLLLLKSDKNLRRNIIIILCSIISYALALTAKLSVVFFPLFIVLFTTYRHCKIDKTKPFKTLITNIRWPLILWIILILQTVGAIILRSRVLGKTAQGIYITGDCWTTWLSMPRIFLRYLYIELVPYPLYADYMNYPAADSLSDPVAWSCAAIFLLVFVSLSWLLDKKRMLEPWLWFWCALLPFSNIIAMNQLGAERFLYIPTIGFAWLVAEIFKRYSLNDTAPAKNVKYEKILIYITFIIFLSYMTLTIQRSRVWSSSLTLWEKTTKQFPDSQRARSNLIKSYINFQQPEKAVPFVKGLIKDYPQQKNFTLYAHIMYLTGNPQSVINALARHKKNVSLNYIAIVAARRNEYDNAEKAATLSYKLNPDRESYDTLNRVALYAAQNGQFLVAERTIFLASTLGKNDNTVNRVGIQAARRGKFDIAERCLKLAAKINPANKIYAKNLEILKRQRAAIKAGKRLR